MSAFPERFAVGLQVRSDGAAGFGGVAVESWAAAVDKPVYAVYPGTPGVDYEPGRSPSQIPMFVLASADSLGGVKARDRIVWNGATFQVEADAEDYNYGPFGFEPGVRVQMLRVEG